MTPAGEFSHKVTVDPWPEDGITVDLSANAAEREALKARFDLVDLPSLSASLEIARKVKELVLAGTIEATVAQTCVVTLQPVEASLKVPLERRYRHADIHERMMASGGASSDDEDAADVDIFEGCEIDVGEAVAEEFYLALDPYPRRADANEVLQEIQARTGAVIGDPPENPFEKLRRH